jgi:hypothetical protein
MASKYWTRNGFIFFGVEQKDTRFGDLLITDIIFGLLHPFKKSWLASKSSPIGEKSPNQVALIVFTIKDDSSLCVYTCEFCVRFRIKLAQWFSKK